MKNLQVIGDWFFSLDMVKDGFSFLADKFDVRCSYALDEAGAAADLIVGWGSGCFDILEQIDNIQGKAIVLMSPYLDFDRFFSWCGENPDWQSDYLYKSGLKGDGLVNPDMDLDAVKSRKVFLNDVVDRKGVYIFVSGNGELIRAEDVLKMEFYFKNSSIHYIEGAGFAPFYEVPDTFREIFNGFVIDETF